MAEVVYATYEVRLFGGKYEGRTQGTYARADGVRARLPSEQKTKGYESPEEARAAVLRLIKFLWGNVDTKEHQAEMDEGREDGR